MCLDVNVCAYAQSYIFHTSVCKTTRIVFATHQQWKTRLHDYMLSSMSRIFYLWFNPCELPQLLLGSIAYDTQARWCCPLHHLQVHDPWWNPEKYWCPDFWLRESSPSYEVRTDVTNHSAKVESSLMRARKCCSIRSAVSGLPYCRALYVCVPDVIGVLACAILVCSQKIHVWTGSQSFDLFREDSESDVCREFSNKRRFKRKHFTLPHLLWGLCLKLNKIEIKTPRVFAIRLVQWLGWVFENKGRKKERNTLFGISSCQRIEDRTCV